MIARVTLEAVIGPQSIGGCFPPKPVHRYRLPNVYSLGRSRT